MAQILDHLTSMLRLEENINENHLQSLHDWKDVEGLFWYAINRFRGSRTQRGTPPMLLFRHYLKVKPYWHLEMDLIIRALMNEIPFDLVSELLSRLPLKRNLVSTILEDMITSYLTSPLDQGHLLMNIEKFFEHNVSNYLQVSTLNRLFFLATVNFPSCNALATMIKRSNYPLQYAPLLEYARDHQRRDIISLVTALFGLNRSRIFMDEGEETKLRWVQYIRHLFDDARTNYCEKCIQTMLQIYRNHNQKVSNDMSHETIRNFFFAKQKQLQAVNVTDVFTMEKVEKIPYVFAYTVYCEREIYIFDLPNLSHYIKEPSNRSNPYTRELFRPEEIQLINETYHNLLKAYGNISSELCSCK